MTAALNASPDLLVVFDLDGTLVDSAPDLVDALNATLALEGAGPLPESQVRTLLGAGARALIERGLTVVGREVPVARMDELFAAFLEHYQAHIADRSRPFEGLARALDRLEADGARLAVATNKLEGLSVSLLSALGLADRFVAICGQDTFREADGRNIPKPDPRMLLGCVARAGGRAERAIMVGDSRTDIDAARNAGMPVIAVDFGYTDTPVDQLGPDVVISHFDGLWDAVQTLRQRAQAGAQAGAQARAQA